MLNYAVLLFASIVCAMVLTTRTETALSQESVSPKNMLTKKCALCHGLSKVQGSLGSKDLAQWRATIQKMRTKGAKMTDQEQESLAAYLSGLKAGDSF